MCYWGRPAEPVCGNQSFPYLAISLAPSQNSRNTVERMRPNWKLHPFNFNLVKPDLWWCSSRSNIYISFRSDRLASIARP
jgi:hypothetical protein